MLCYAHKMAIVSWPWTLWRHVTPCIPVNISQTTVAEALNDTNGRLTCCGFMHKTDISKHVVLLLAEETPNAYKTKSAMTGAAGKLNISCRSGSGSNVIIARRQAEYIWINQERLRQRRMEVPASFHRLVRSCLFSRAHFCVISYQATSVCGYAKHKLWPIVTVVAWSVCVSVCWRRAWAVPKRMNRSTCHLGYGLVGTTETYLGWEPGSPIRKKALFLIQYWSYDLMALYKSVYYYYYYYYTPTCPRSIFSTLFARGLQRCGFWPPVCCSNLSLNNKRVFAHTQTQSWQADWLHVGKADHWSACVSGR